MASKEEELLGFLQQHVFDPVLSSPTASSSLKAGVRLTMARMSRLNAEKMVQYYWSAVIGTERSPGFAKQMREEGFLRFEEVLEQFRNRFNDRWLMSNS